MTTVAELPQAELSRLMVERYQAGDRDAFAEIYRCYYSTVYGFLLYRYPNRSVAEDLTQETFIRAIGGLTRWQWQGSDVGAFLVTIARRLIADHLRSAYERRETPVADIFATAPTWASADDPVGAVLDREKAALHSWVLAESLPHLTEEQRTCLLLRYVEENSIDRTAEILGSNSNAVKALTYRATHRLATLIDREAVGR